MKVLNFGSLNIDNVYNLDDFPMPGETISSRSFRTYCGGKGLNQTIAIQKCGVQVYHAGLIGKDGDFLVDYLKKYNVNTNYIKEVDTSSGHALIQVNNKGENSIILHDGANKQISKAFIDEVLKDFKAGDILVLQNEISNIGYLMEEAHKKEMCIFFNPAPFDENVLEYPLDTVNYLIVNELEAMGLTNTKSIDDALKILEKKEERSKIVVTLGEKGSFLYSDKTFYQKAYKVKVQDTTAAGDTFIGFLIGCIVLGHSEEIALGIATKAAAIAVTREGASSSIPTMREVEKAIF